MSDDVGDIMVMMAMTMKWISQMVIPEFELLSVPAHRFGWQAPTIDCVDLLWIADGTHQKTIHCFPLFPPLHTALKLIVIRIHPLCYIVDTFHSL